MGQIALQIVAITCASFDQSHHKSWQARVARVTGRFVPLPFRPIAGRFVPLPFRPLHVSPHMLDTVLSIL